MKSFKPNTSPVLKALLVVFFVVASGAYVFLQNKEEGGTPAAIPVQQMTISNPLPPDTAPVASSSPSAGTAPASTPAPVPAQSGQYKSGIYTGSAANAFYGIVQVEAIISNGQLADVKFLQYPNDRSTSRFINSQAMPMLTQEALQAQSANVDGVSGATDTSAAFVESLSSALAKAKA